MKKMVLSRQKEGLGACIRSPERKSCSAFTLIELLVVIAIIAILAAILLPVLSQAQIRGMMTADLNNFKQLQICWHMYILDNNDFLPQNFVNGGGALSNSWVVGDVQTDVTEQNVEKGVLFQYNTQTKIYQCPANTKLIPVAGLPPLGSGLKPNQLVPQTRTCSIEYSLGGNASETPAGPWSLSRSKDSGITFNSYQKYSQLQTTRIASKIVFCDEAQATLDDGAFALFPWVASSPINYWWNMAGSRHGRGTVWSFADGHAEYWKWHGSVVTSNLVQTTYEEEDVPGDSSDDLPRVEAAGAQYP
ncbi:MAG TPA: prepilin-type N-terminal cleavage/methylation domain-containing protein [Alphaproteobacteria bacterium]|nr:prepilin-type N-terminal cleavage/methylation domain-containing protein [Alphaproteobacteria bacterium]